MPVDIIKRLTKGCDDSVELRLIIQNAAVLKGRRISGMLFLNDKELALISEKLQGTSISLMILSTFRKRHLVSL